MRKVQSTTQADLEEGRPTEMFPKQFNGEIVVMGLRSLSPRSPGPCFFRPCYRTDERQKPAKTSRRVPLMLLAQKQLQGLGLGIGW